MTYYARSRTGQPFFFGSACISTEWTKLELEEAIGDVLEAHTDDLEVRTEPPGLALNPSGKVWYPGFNSRLVDE